MQYDQNLVDLFQDYCAHHELVHHFSPLTAQIYTYIMFNNNRDSVTFDELVERLNASKSSVSTSLNLLISNNQIEHFNKIDERKRYFRLNPNYMTLRLQIIRDVLEREHALCLKMLKFVDEGVLKTDNCNNKVELYIDHLAKSKSHLADTIEKLKSTN
ncbi:GbsR/MarR family transcriptional regulator [Myroides odoratimimus]|uniref:GbsR/MarR family transcriptional regulator n=1 Tax=Myroides odoratimimus TaxID=76832 RepID=UPI00257813CC|nr:transcriptional regulator [Myroides odoratimimus]MDM1497303.1 transcriptional regulator [Myroides odoratimimus]